MERRRADTVCGQDDRQMGRKRIFQQDRRRPDTVCGGDGRQIYGAERKRILFSRTRSRHMIILRGSAQPTKSESLNQIFSKSLKQNFFIYNKCFTHLLVI